MGKKLITLGFIKAEFLEELARMGITELRTTRKSTVLYGRTSSGDEVRIKLRRVPKYSKRGKIIGVDIEWKVEYVR